MNERDTAVWWAKVRSGGPQREPAGSRSPDGMRRLVESDAQSVWLLAHLPTGAGPHVLAEYGQEPMTLSDLSGTLRVLAACLRCCWADPAADPWPGRLAGLEQVDTVLAALTPGRDRISRRRLLTAGLRRLETSRWVLPTPGHVRLGPRVSAWTAMDLSTLREMWRMLPSSDHPTSDHLQEQA
ncbi:hypothetical protein GCM10011608_11310 [Micromonospora sonchi]|uniref:Uncharacterized protein n=1 Tax=Micromonospora sonchi TaxID=1763543 RepID=A0A917TLZ1_9ACTN|nr:hypothetical protein [Micromonospora sonchi]GGM28208.1 hypothetical protein GCM10011608_11310 [Micromonospora sonchi]